MAGAWFRLWRTVRGVAARFGLDGSRDASTEVCTVHGVVGPEGVCGERIAPAGDWMLRFSLSPWRIGRGAAVDEKLHVRRPATNEELVAFQRALPPGTAICIRVRLEPGAATLTAGLVEPIEPKVFGG